MIAAVINITPDSFYPDSRAKSLKEALKMAENALENGADILDIGGESTRPGARPVQVKVEIKRVIPVIEEIKKRFNAKISIDTYKPEVAYAALSSGAEILNDIYALRQPGMLEVVMKFKPAVILMHMRKNPLTMQNNPRYKNVVKDIYSFLKDRIKHINGINYYVDPGIGFGKTVRHNIEILKNIHVFKKLGKVAIGVSRKSFIGRIINKKNPPPPEERLAGTIAVTSYLVLKEIDMLRVHDVKETAEVIKIIKCLK